MYEVKGDSSAAILQRFQRQDRRSVRLYTVADGCSFATEFSEFQVKMGQKNIFGSIVDYDGNFLSVLFFTQKLSTSEFGTIFAITASATGYAFFRLSMSDQLFGFAGVVREI